jgi:hypothetical protein
MKASNRRSMRGMQDYDRGRYEYGDRFSGYGTSRYTSGQYGGEIDYRTTGTGGYRTAGSYGAGSTYGATGGMSGFEGQSSQSWGTPAESHIRDEHHHDLESDWTGEGDAPARKSGSSQA